MTTVDDLLRTPLYDDHCGLGAKMVPFAGYSMPVQYPLGVLKEHQHTRSEAGLFDVSHMGQIRVEGEQAAAFLESCLPTDIHGLEEGRQVYSLLLNDDGGIEDDLMVARLGGGFTLVVNAACKHSDLQRLQAAASDWSDVTLTPDFDRGLLALQGPAARKVLASLLPEAEDARFMDVREAEFRSHRIWYSCSGYTGEDGFELSLDGAGCKAMFEALLAFGAVEPVGLGARDSLRLESGLCLYGHDMDASRSPVEASLSWAIAKVRRRGGEREGGFPGAAAILGQLEDGVDVKRVLFDVDGRAPVREGIEVCLEDGTVVGSVTSGGFGPSVGAPVAMGYVKTGALEQPLFALVRKKRVALSLRKGAFITQRYVR